MTKKCMSIALYSPSSLYNVTFAPTFTTLNPCTLHRVKVILDANHSIEVTPEEEGEEEEAEVGPPTTMPQ